MGFLNRLKKKGTASQHPVEMMTEPGRIYAPVTGTYIPLEEIPDPVFAEGVLGPGCGIEPEEGEVLAPVTGEVCLIADTGHAIAVRSEDGVEIMIHVGMDTVNLNGKGFDVRVALGEKVTCGTLLLLFEMDQIKKAGYSTTTALLITNAAQYPSVHFDTGKMYQATEKVGIVQ